MDRHIVEEARGWLWRVYLRPRSWEWSGRVYEALGVRLVKELLFGGRYFNALVGWIQGRRYRPFRGPRWPSRWLRFTMIVEAGHIAIGVYMLAGALGHVLGGRWMFGIRSLLMNAVINLYPVCVQRYNRARLLKIFGQDELLTWGRSR